MLIEKECKWCGATFATEKRAVQFCCEDHRISANKMSVKKYYEKNKGAIMEKQRDYRKRKRNEESHMVEKKCPICGEIFRMDHAGPRIYCGEKCAKKAKNLKKMEGIFGKKEDRRKKKETTIDDALKAAGSSRGYINLQAQETIDMYARVDADSIMSEIDTEKSNDQNYAILMVSLMLKGWGKNV